MNYDSFRYIIIQSDRIPRHLQDEFNLLREQIFKYHNELTNLQQKYNYLFDKYNDDINIYKEIYNNQKNFIDNITLNINTLISNNIKLKEDINNLNSLNSKISDIQNIFKNKYNKEYLKIKKINSNLENELHIIKSEYNILKKNNKSLQHYKDKIVLSENKIIFLEKMIEPLKKKESEYKEKFSSLNLEIEKLKYSIRDRDHRIDNLTSKVVKKQLLEVFVKYSENEIDILVELEKEKEKNEIISSVLKQTEKKLKIQANIIESLKIKTVDLHSLF